MPCLLLYITLHYFILLISILICHVDTADGWSLSHLPIPWSAEGARISGFCFGETGFIVRKFFEHRQGFQTMLSSQKTWLMPTPDRPSVPVQGNAQRLGGMHQGSTSGKCGHLAPWSVRLRLLGEETWVGEELLAKLSGSGPESAESLVETRELWLTPCLALWALPVVGLRYYMLKWIIG